MFQSIDHDATLRQNPSIMVDRNLMAELQIKGTRRNRVCTVTHFSVYKRSVPLGKLYNMNA